MAEALRLCRLRSLAVATPESSAPTSGIATRPLRLHACSSRCCTTPPKLVVISPLPLAGGAAGTLPYAYAYASVSLCRCHALSAAQAVHSCHISGREVFSSVNFTSLFVRRCWRIIGSRQPHATPTPVPSARASVPQSASHRSSPSPSLRFGVRAANQHGTQPDGASRSPTYPPLCDDGFAYRFPQHTHCFSSWTRRTATTNHCADILCRHSLLQGECRP